LEFFLAAPAGRDCACRHLIAEIQATTEWDESAATTAMTVPGRISTMGKGIIAGWSGSDNFTH